MTARPPDDVDFAHHLPDYEGAALNTLVPALFAPGRPAAWLPDVVRDAAQVVLLVIDGLGWRQLQERRALAPTLASMAGTYITSVAPTTTACALSSITLGAPPSVHGVVGYRMRVQDDRILNVLRWRTADGDASESVPAKELQPEPAFAGRDVPVVTRSYFAASGFTDAHLGGVRLHGWQQASGIAVEVGQLLRAGEPFVYAYYDGVDATAHSYGFGPHYDAELTAADRLVADLAETLPAGAVLVVTADHGQVDVGDNLVMLDEEVQADVALASGEPRFLWLHAVPGRAEALFAACAERYGATRLASVVTRETVEAEAWFGGALTPEVARRLGDVAIVARRPVAFFHPAELGSAGLRCRHGALTADELLVPLLAVD